MWKRFVLSCTILCRQLFAVQKIGLALLILVVSRHTPSCLHRDGGDGYVPAHPEPAVAAAAAVGQRKVGLHSLPSGGNLYRVAQVGRAAVVGCGRLHQRETLQRVGGLQLLDARGRVGRGLRHLRGLQHRVDEIQRGVAALALRGYGHHIPHLRECILRVGQVILRVGQSLLPRPEPRADQQGIRVQGIALDGHPAVVLPVIDVGLYVVLGETLRQQRGVIGQGNPVFGTRSG